MAVRLTRRRAGEKVEAAALAYLRKTGRMEQDAKDRIAGILEEHATPAERLFRRRVEEDRDSLRRVVSDARFLDRLVAAHRDAVGATEQVMVDTVRASFREAHRSIVRELRWVEQTMAVKYRGLATEVGSVLAGVSEDLVLQVRDRYAAQEAACLVQFEEAVRKQLYLAAEKPDDPVVVVRRVFSPTPVRAKGISGRGVWHRSASGLAGVVTHASIGGGGEIRLTAMRLFNEIGAKRA